MTLAYATYFVCTSTPTDELLHMHVMSALGAESMKALDIRGAMERLALGQLHAST